MVQALYHALHAVIQCFLGTLNIAAALEMVISLLFTADIAEIMPSSFLFLLLFLGHPKKKQVKYIVQSFNNTV